MLLIRLWNYIRGYVVFRLEGLNLERVINLAVSKNVFLWDIKRINYTTIEAKVGIRGYKELRRIIKKTGCKAKINTKIGYPFFVSRIKRRKMIGLGLIISFVIIIFFTSFIWSIDIDCNNETLKTNVLESLQEMGLYEGALKYNVDISKIENNILIKYDKIAWIGIEIEGTKAEVKIVEKKEIPKGIDKNIPCHIVAKKRGIIEKIIAKNGEPMVKKGDIVMPNQILISGTIKIGEDNIRYVHSLGEVYARTYYEKTEKMPIYKIIKNKTGKKHIKRTLKVGDALITLNTGEIPFKKFILETKHKSFTKWRNIKIPVEIIIEEYFEVVEEKKQISADEVKESLKEYLLVNLMKDIPKEAKIINKSYEFKKDDNFIIGYLIIEALESIGTKKNIN